MTADTRPEVTEWISTAMPDGTDTPCGHYTATSRSTCGAVPTRQYIGGRLCYDHAPNPYRGKEAT